MLDVVIRGGEVVDGTGAPRRRADVGIAEGKVVTIGEVDASAHHTIDAEGRIVAPGFVDIHTHYDAQVLWDPYLTPSVLHGVTTVIGGNCGFTIAPLVTSETDYLRKLLARVEGMALESLEAGVDWNWTSTDEFLRKLDDHLAVNAGFMVGHTTIRRLVMGDDATRRVARADELDEMRALLSSGLRAGGLGLSSSWGLSHTDPNGDPVPSRCADRSELLALAEVCGEFEGTSLEFIPSGVSWDEGCEVMGAMSATAGRPLNWNLLRVSDARREEVEEKLLAGTRAAAVGGRVVALTMPMPLVFRYNFRPGWLLSSLPGWSKPMTLPPKYLLALLRDPATRRDLEELAGQAERNRLHSDWANRVIAETFTPETKRYEGRMVRDIALEEGKRPFDALVDIVVADELRTVFTNVPDPTTPADWAAQRDVWRDERALIGASDAGAHLDFLSTFALQTWFLDEVVRKESVIGLEEAVHYFTGAPASLYGLRARGVLGEGSCADVVVFDEATVGSDQVHTRFDMPGGAGRLFAEAIGVDHVLVNGHEVVDHGELLEGKPGRVIRGGVNTVTPSMEPPSGRGGRTN
jgi:N-acyl-D-aspartate/D-glutamate deacylase